MVPDLALELEAARAVVARPDFHSRRGILRACDVLDRAGDWMDRERVLHLRRAIKRETVLRLDDAISVALLFALLTAALWISAGLGLPTGGEELMQQVRH